MHEAVVNYEMGESSGCTYMGPPLLYVPVEPPGWLDRLLEVGRCRQVN